MSERGGEGVHRGAPDGYVPPPPTAHLSQSGTGRPNDAPDDEPLFGGTPFRDAHTGGDLSGSSDVRAYYSLLNVDRDATEDEIRDAYKTLAGLCRAAAETLTWAVAFHPDKHPDPQQKELAEETFRSIKKAYDVLCDAGKRTVYDHFGEEGLESSWAVSVRGQTPEEMRAEFERQTRLRQAADAENLVKSKGEFAATVDASSLFAPARMPMPLRRRQKPDTWNSRLNRVNCTQLVGKHGFDMQVTNTSSVTLAGQMMSRNGLGGGNLVGTIKTHWSPRFFTENTATLMRPNILTSKGQFTLDDNVFFTYAVVSQTLGAPPGLTLTWGQRLSSTTNLTGFTSFKTGSYSVGSWGVADDGTYVRPDIGALVVGVTKQHDERTGWTSQCTISDVDQVLAYEMNARLFGILLTSGVQLGTGSGLSTFVNGEQRVTENVRVGLGVECGLATGVIFKVRVVRLGQRLVLPILLAPQFRADLAAAATLVPAAGVALAHYLYFVPKQQRDRVQRIEDLRRRNADAIHDRHMSAEHTRELLRGQALKRCEAEGAKHGLVVVQALYGRKELFPPPVHVPADVFTSRDAMLDFVARPPEAASAYQSADQPLVWDVRFPVEMLVSRGQLVIPAGRSKVRTAPIRLLTRRQSSSASSTLALASRRASTCVISSRIRSTSYASAMRTRSPRHFDVRVSRGHH